MVVENESAADTVSTELVRSGRAGLTGPRAGVLNPCDEPERVSGDIGASASALYVRRPSGVTSTIGGTRKCEGERKSEETSIEMSSAWEDGVRRRPDVTSSMR